MQTIELSCDICRYISVRNSLDTVLENPHLTATEVAYIHGALIELDYIIKIIEKTSTEG